MSVIEEVPQVKEGADGATTHGTPVQFSNAALLWKVECHSLLHGIYNDFLVVNDMYFPTDTIFPG